MPNLLFLGKAGADKPFSSVAGQGWMGGRVRGGVGGGARSQHGSDERAIIRYLAGVSGLGSLVQAAVAIGRGRALTERLSEWDEAIVLATMSAGAHLIANHLDKAI